MDPEAAQEKIDGCIMNNRKLFVVLAFVVVLLAVGFSYPGFFNELFFTGEASGSLGITVTINESEAEVSEDTVDVEDPDPSGSSCKPKWECEGWSECQNAKGFFDQGALSLEDYEFVKADCLENLDFEETCGFQINPCVDLIACGSLKNKPDYVRACEYPLEPSCSDGIQNFGELGIDCGGQCPFQCVSEKPQSFIPALIALMLASRVASLLWILGLILVLIFIWWIFFYKRRKGKAVKKRLAVKKRA